MTLHVAVAGWLLGPHSGANRRLLSLLRYAGPQLTDRERITVLHRPDFSPAPLPHMPGVRWQAVPIGDGPPLRRALAERRHLARTLRTLQANVFDHAFLPLPHIELPSCLTVHDTRAADGLSRWPRWLARAVLRSACARAAVVIAPSQWTADRITQLAPAARTRVVPNGVELPHGQPALFAPLPPNGYLLHAGHLEPRKNLAILVQALRLLAPAQRPQLWLAGRDAGSLPKLRHLAAADVELRSLGAVTDGELAQLYAHARAVVMPSCYEGFGLPVLEALAHGRPVLASALTALPEVLGNCGTLLPANDAAAWAKAIADTATRGLALASHRARAAEFGWSAAAAALLAIWRQLRN